MARYTEPVCRLCRREGLKLYLKGDRCYSDKCAIVKRPYAPGQHGQQRKKVSEYGIQLREKQKVRRVYGVAEKQFRIAFAEAERRGGVAGENMLQLLESRLDNVVYRMGLAASRVEARQLIGHGHFTINGKKVDIASYIVRVGEEIAVREKSRSSNKFAEIAEALAHRQIPAWLDVDKANLRGKVVALPSREDVDIPITEQLVVELYSR